MTTIKSSLSRDQERELCSWLGLVKFSLLYKASVHGYSASVFHQKCDVQGPTITVGYNKTGFVFGGFTRKDFSQTWQNIIDDEAFLFCIKGKDSFRFPVTKGQYALVDGNAGPTFAEALVFLNQNTAAVTSNPGNSYNFNAAELHGNDLALTECEVYRVEELENHLEKPWRKIMWKPERRKELIDSLKNYKPIINSVNKAQILLIGPVGVGKSSFFNSINSVFRGHVTSQAISGYAGMSLTTQFRTYSIKVGRDGTTLPFILCDTMGLEVQSGAGLDVDDVNNILKGHIPDRYQFNPSAPFQDDALGFCKSVALADRIHCVVYVLDACKVSLMPTELEKKLAAIRRKVNLMGVPQLVLLTKVDEACPRVAEDVTNVYHSYYIKKKIEEASALLGMPVSCVVPVKNYSQELELDLSCDILLLSAILQMLRFADDYFDDNLCQNDNQE